MYYLYKGNDGSTFLSTQEAADKSVHDTFIASYIQEKDSDRVTVVDVVVVVAVVVVIVVVIIMQMKIVENTSNNFLSPNNVMHKTVLT